MGCDKMGDVLGADGQPVCVHEAPFVLFVRRYGKPDPDGKALTSITLSPEDGEIARLILRAANVSHGLPEMAPPFKFLDKVPKLKEWLPK